MDSWLDTISIDQFAMWEAYYVLEPWGEDRADLRAGTIAAMIFNTNIISGTKPARPEDFLIVRPEDFDKIGQKKAPMSAEGWASFKSQMAKTASVSKGAPKPKKWIPKRGRRKEEPQPDIVPDTNPVPVAETLIP